MKKAKSNQITDLAPLFKGSCLQSRLRDCKRIISLVLSVCMLLSITAGIDLSAFARETYTISYLSFTFENGEATLIHSNTLATGEMVIPSEVKGCPVTTIGPSAFRLSNHLTSIIIPNSVKKIEEHAFESCTSLESITVPESVEYMGGNPFASCKSLTDIDVDPANKNYLSLDGILIDKNGIIVSYPAGRLDSSPEFPEGVKGIGAYAFQNMRPLESVVIPDFITELGENAFYDCYNLKSVAIGKGVTKIGKYAFCFCGNLEKVTLSEGLKSIGDSAFDGCDLDEINIPYGVTDIGYGAFRSNGNLTKATIPNSVTSIGDYAFSNCKKLSDLTFSDSVVFIGSEAFNNCAITKIAIPDSVVEIASAAFCNCSNLSDISIPDCVIDFGYEVFKGTAYYNNQENWFDDLLYAGNHLLGSNKKDTSITVKDGTLSIAGEVFKDCEQLTSVALPDSLLSIGGNAFYNCKGLTDVVIPDSVVFIGDGAFENCENLKSVALPDGLIKIGQLAFAYCMNLENIKLGSGLKEIEGGAFFRCQKLTDITIPENVELINGNIFCFCSGLKNIVVDSNNKFYASVNGVLFNKDKTALISYPCGKEDVKYLVPNSVETICQTSFEENRNLKVVIIPNSVTTIGSYAFYNIDLDCVILGTGLKLIEQNAFALFHGEFLYTGTEQQWNDIEIESWIGYWFRYNFPTPVASFLDLKGFEVYEDYLFYTSVNNSFIKGTNPPYYTEFSPTTAITRAMFVTILYRMAGAPYDEVNPHTITPFTDITNTSVYYYNAACWALDNGITTQKTFKPNDLVVREQTASFLFRYASNEGFVDDSYTSVDLSKYSDLSTVSSWAVPAMQWANQQGMITGTQQGTLNPKGSTLRIHATKILYGFGRACGIGNGLPM